MSMLTMGKQTVEFLGACGLGFLIGLYYEFFRSVRLVAIPSVASCVFQDIFFCVSSALLTFFVFLGLADGVMYPYLFLGELLGFYIFRGSLGKVVHVIFAGLLALLKRFWDAIAKRFFEPIMHSLSRKIMLVIKKLGKSVKNIEKTRKKFIFFSKKP